MICRRKLAEFKPERILNSRSTLRWRFKNPFGEYFSKIVTWVGLWENNLSLLKVKWKRRNNVREVHMELHRRDIWETKLSQHIIIASLSHHYSCDPTHCAARWGLKSVDFKENFWSSLKRFANFSHNSQFSGSTTKNSSRFWCDNVSQSDGPCAVPFVIIIRQLTGFGAKWYIFIFLVAFLSHKRELRIECEWNGKREIESASYLRI